MSQTDRVTRLERWISLSKRLAFEENQNGLLRKALESIVELSKADHGFFLIREGGRPRVKAIYKLQQRALHSPRYRAYRRIADHVLREEEPFLSADLSVDSRIQEPNSASAPLRSVLAACIPGQNKPLGAFLLARLHDGRQPLLVDDLRLAQDMAELTGGFLSHLRELQQLRRQEALRRTQGSLEGHSFQEESPNTSTEIRQFEHSLGARNRARTLRYAFQNIVGRSPQIYKVFEILDQVMDYSIPILITGESGTGKELIVRALHQGGERAQAPFLAINCAAMPATLLESELFGFKKGAFTGADKDKQGLFVAARNGTLFLDEIGEMPLELQVKLLRVVQEQEVLPLGSNQAIPFQARIITATHRDLLEHIREGLFREDLYYRLKVVEISLPPLRERAEDIPLLAEHFLERFVKELKLKSMRLSPEALQALMRRPWPGNVRELENLIKSSAILCRGPIIEIDDLGLEPEALNHLNLKSNKTPPQALQRSPISTRAEWRAQEKQEILEMLIKTRWNKTRAAQLLGISRRNLYRKLNIYGIEGSS